MILGFTGSRSGMTADQIVVVRRLLLELKPTKVVHGDCYGSDNEFHQLVTLLRSAQLLPDVKIKTRPSNLSTSCNNNADETEIPVAPLVRDKLIVADADKMLATPAQNLPILRSGTWTTIRYAHQTGKVIYIITPDGYYK